MKRLAFVLFLAALATACGSSTTAPTATVPAATTRIITVSGNLAFGDVNIGATSDRTFTVNNSGTGTLTFTSVSASGGTGTAGYTATPTSGTIAPGATLTMTVRFAPTIAQFYSAVLSVVGDQTSGGAAINVSGSGINNTPLFTQSGVGNNVFNMPTTVTRIHIQGVFTGFTSNFIVTIGGRLVVNDLVGSAWTPPVSDGVYLTTGGVVAITNSGGVSWTFTEVR